VSSARAVEIGLAARELAPEQLLSEMNALAARIAQHPIGPLRHTKRLVRESERDAIRAARAREDAAFRERIGSPENLEAIRAFFAKRR
jgi:enoyl-CoA hydratase/carnithine racemase